MKKKYGISLSLILILVMTVSCTAKYRNLQSFETVWNTVNEKHYDPDFGGVDWKALHDHYKPKIEAAENGSAFYKQTNQMLFELNLSHLLVATGEDLKNYVPILMAKGSIGIDIKWMDGEAVVTAVRPGSPADRAGLRQGHTIIGIEGKSIEEMVSNEKLLNGAYFMHTILQPLPSDGRIIENNGVIPDIEVSLYRDALLAGRDTQLEAAVRYILEKN